MTITPPTTRAGLAKLVPSGGIVIELGVAAGKFAAEMLETNPSIIYHGIDRWSDHHDTDEMECAQARLWPWRERATLIRSTFAKHLPWVEDASADLIYVDGYAHTGQEGGQTLRDWWPKLKPGGIFAGHDYDPTHYPQTVAAVDDFARDMALEIRIIEEIPHPSWWTIKPCLKSSY